MPEIATFECSDVRISVPVPMLRALLSTVLADEQHPATPTAPQVPQIAAHEHYAGIKLDAETGEPIGHLVVIAIADKRRTWQEQKKWAESVGGRLPDRQEGPVLYGNLKRLFEDAYYWLDTEYSADYAWGQDFYGGTQYYYDKDYEAFAVAVRLIPITNSSI
jgi:hypothetical protein